VVLQDKASLGGGSGGCTGDVREIRKNSEEKHCPDNLYESCMEICAV